MLSEQRTFATPLTQGSCSGHQRLVARSHPLTECGTCTILVCVCAGTLFSYGICAQSSLPFHVLPLSRSCGSPYGHGSSAYLSGSLEDHSKRVCWPHVAPCTLWDLWHTNFLTRNIKFILTSLMSRIQSEKSSSSSENLNSPSVHQHSRLGQARQDPRKSVSGNESFCLAPIASVALPQLRIQDVSQNRAARLNEGLLDISARLMRLEEATSSPQTSSQHDPETLSHRLRTPGSSDETPLQTTRRHHQRPDVKQRRLKGPKGNVSMFTFVSMKSIDGKRDWEAETQIRSHAARRVQASRVHRNEIQVSPTPPIESRTRVARPCLPRGEDLQYTEREEQDMPLVTPPCLQHRDNADGKVFGHLRCGECDGIEVFHESDEGDVGVHYLSGMTNPFGQSLFDPFGQMASPITHRMHELLSHCESNEPRPRAAWKQEQLILIRVAGIFHYSPKIVPMIYGRNNISRLGVEHELKDAMEDDVACHVISATAGIQQSELMLKTSASVDSAIVISSRLRHEEALRHLQTGIQRLNRRFTDHKQTLSPTTIINIGRLAVASV